MQQQQLSTLMKISWQIQKRKQLSRSKSLISAWAITQNEDITVFYLVRKHSSQHSKKVIDTNILTLFNHI